MILTDTHGLARNELDDGGIARLDKFGVVFERLTSPAVDLLLELSELAGNVGGVTIEDGSVTSTNLTRVVEDDDLGIEGGSLFGRVVLGVGGDITTADVLNRNVSDGEDEISVDKRLCGKKYALDIETNIVTGVALFELFVMHFDRLHFSGHVRGSEGDNHASLDDTGLNTTNGHRTNATDLVDILEGKTERFVGRANGRLDGIDGIKESLALDGTTLDLLRPTLVPSHARNYR